MLQVRGLSKNYGAVYPVRGLSFDVGEREVVGLLGVNGAGKSTTMRMLAGYLAPTTGSIEMDGLSMVESPRDAKRLVGYLPETPPLYLDMTVREQLRFVCDLRGVSIREQRAACDEVASLLNITHVMGRLNGHLSKGYRQRVGFAAALLGSPRLLILDEPTSGLDPRQMIDIRHLIQQLSEKRSILISSHVLSEIESVCTRLLILVNGNLAADGTPEEILKAHGRAAELSLRVAGDAALAERLVRQLMPPQTAIDFEMDPAGGGARLALSLGEGAPDEKALFMAFAPHAQQVQLVELTRLQPSLEEVFIDITRRARGSGEEESA